MCPSVSIDFLCVALPVFPISSVQNGWLGRQTQAWKPQYPGEPYILVGKWIFIPSNTAKKLVLTQHFMGFEKSWADFSKIHSRLLVTKLKSEFAGVRGVDDHLVLPKKLSGWWLNQQRIKKTWCCSILEGCLQDRRITNLRKKCLEPPRKSDAFVKMANCSSLTQKMCKKKKK